MKIGKPLFKYWHHIFENGTSNWGGNADLLWKQRYPLFLLTVKESFFGKFFLQLLKCQYQGTFSYRARIQRNYLVFSPLFKSLRLFSVNKSFLAFVLFVSRSRLMISYYIWWSLLVRFFFRIVFEVKMDSSEETVFTKSLRWYNHCSNGSKRWLLRSSRWFLLPFIPL